MILAGEVSFPDIDAGAVFTDRGDIADMVIPNDDGMRSRCLTGRITGNGCSAEPVAGVSPVGKSYAECLVGNIPYRPGAVVEIAGIRVVHAVGIRRCVACRSGIRAWIIAGFSGLEEFGNLNPVTVILGWILDILGSGSVIDPELTAIAVDHARHNAVQTVAFHQNHALGKTQQTASRVLGIQQNAAVPFQIEVVFCIEVLTSALIDPSASDLDFCLFLLRQTAWPEIGFSDGEFLFFA